MGLHVSADDWKYHTVVVADVEYKVLACSEDWALADPIVQAAAEAAYTQGVVNYAPHIVRAPYREQSDQQQAF